MKGSLLSYVAAICVYTSSTVALPTVKHDHHNGHDHSTSLFPLRSFPLQWSKYAGNPIISPDTSHSWEEAYTYNPAAWVQDDKVYMIYRAQNKAKISAFGLATSDDGYQFTRLSNPIFTPSGDLESHGVEDPRVVRVNETYYMTYTAYDGTSARLCLATSTNLTDWTRYGAMFPNFNVLSYDGKGSVWSKSGAILPWKQPNGKYMMYFGEGSIWYSYSEDLLHWDQNPTRLFSHTNVTGQFDADLVETGPPPIQTTEGTLFLYNGAQLGTNYKNYSVGEVLLDSRTSTKILQRTTRAVIIPTTPQEASPNVQTPNVTFAEGLVYFKNKALLYYGQGDQFIGVATGKK